MSWIQSEIIIVVVGVVAVIGLEIAGRRHVAKKNNATKFDKKTAETTPPPQASIYGEMKLKSEQPKSARGKKERAAAEQREKARLEQERRAKEQAEQAARDSEKEARERAAAEQREKVRLEQERRAKEQAEQAARDRAEKEERERAAAEEREKARLEQERRAKEQAERAARDRAEKEARERAAAEQREKARLEQERRAKEQAEQAAMDRAEKEARERAAAEEREKARLEQERRAKEQAERAAVKQAEIRPQEAVRDTDNAPVPDKAVESPVSGLLAEVSANLKIAREPGAGKPEPFRTEIWDSRNGEISDLPVEVQSGLSDVYNDIRMANNMVWLITEVGATGSDLEADYNTICDKIAMRLATIKEQLPS